MANEEQLVILKQGVHVWNKWHEENFGVYIDFSGANLKKISLFDETAFVGANLIGAVFSEADLRGANLSFANLTVSSFDNTNLTSANLSSAVLSHADLLSSNLKRTVLHDVNFIQYLRHLGRRNH